jgi:hypothetical protein
MSRVRKAVSDRFLPEEFRAIALGPFTSIWSEGIHESTSFAEGIEPSELRFFLNSRRDLIEFPFVQISIRVCENCLPSSS